MSDEINDTAPRKDELAVGDMVEVEPRTWPGINKPGGVARITATKKDDDGDLLLDVAYVIGGRDKDVPAEFVIIAPVYDASETGSKLRNRSMLMGRCHCGSLFVDCGGCSTFAIPMGFARPRKRKNPEERRERSEQKIGGEEKTSRDRMSDTASSLVQLVADEESSSSDEDDQVLSNLIKEGKNIFRRQNKMKVKWKKHFSGMDLESREISAGIGATVISENTVEPNYSSSDEEAIENFSQNQGDLQANNHFVEVRCFSNGDNDKESPTFLGVHDPSEVSGQFVQPEGADAVSRLPDDVNDQTRNLPFTDLPEFFATTAKRMESKDLPKSDKIVSNLQAKWNSLLHSTSGKGESPMDTQCAFHQECIAATNELQECLVRNGIDQCSAAMRRMESRKLYKQNKHLLSASERKQFRSYRLCELRDLQLGMIEDRVSEIMSKIKQLVRETEPDQMSDASLSDCDASVSSTSSSIVPGAVDEQVSPYIEPDLRQLPAFTPHAHASYVPRRPNVSTQNTKPRRSSALRSRKVRKAPRNQSFPDTDDTRPSWCQRRAPNKAHVRKRRRGEGVSNMGLMHGEDSDTYSEDEQSSNSNFQPDPFHTHDCPLDYEESAMASPSRFANATCFNRVAATLSGFNADSAPLQNNPANFLETALPTWKSLGYGTILELLSSRSSDSSYYINLLAGCVKALSRKPHNFSEEQSVCAKFVENPSQFYEMSMLQLVDALYSVLIPRAWASKFRSRSRVFKMLLPLRDALAGVFNIMENFSICILRNLGPQVWRQGNGENQWFVSSVDPEAWKTFISSGTVAESPQITRFSMLGKILPRCEIDALWEMLDYIDQGNQFHVATGSSRWQLIAKMFSMGILRPPKPSCSLPPCDEEAEACCKELRHFLRLMSSGSLGCPPNMDSMMVNIVDRSLELGLDNIIGSKLAGDKFLASIMKCSDQIASWRDLLEHLSKIISASDPRAATSLHSGNSLLSVPPSSDFLSLSIRLLREWNRLIPNKKARRLRLSKSLQGLASSLSTKLAECRNSLDAAARPSYRPTTFAEAFSVDLQSRPSDMVLKSSFLSEALGHIRAVACISRPDQPSCRNFHAELWADIADDGLKSRRNFILRGYGYNSEASQASQTYKGDIVFLFSVVKALSTWIECYRPVSVTQTGRHNHLVVESLNECVVCLFTCLDCVCDLGDSLEARSFILSQIVLNLSIISNCSSSKQILPTHVTSFILVLARCFNACPSLARGQMYKRVQSDIEARLRSLTSTEILDSSNVDDEFDEFDDSVLLSINLDS